MELKHIVSENFAAEVEQAAGPVLVDFWAPWCGYCRRLMPAVEAVAAERAGRLNVVKVNIDDAPALAERFEIMTIPSLILFQNGKHSETFVNPPSKSAIDTWLDQQGAQ